MMKLYLLMVQKSLILLYGPKFLFYEDLTRIRDAEAEKEWQPNQRSLLNKGKKLHLKLLTCKVYAVFLSTTKLIQAQKDLAANSEL
jgi:hypothetical protein